MLSADFSGRGGASLAIGLASDDPNVLRTYLDRYRLVFRTRLTSVTALVAAVAASLTLKVAAEFAVVHYALFGLFIWAVEHARARVAEPGAGARLRWQSMILAFLIAAHGTGMALYVDHIAPKLHFESVLLIMTLVGLTGLQVHLSAAGFLLAMAPPILCFVVVTRPEWRQGDIVPHLWAGGLFIFAMLAAAWRQQRTDAESAMAAAALARRNDELQAALRAAEDASRAKTEFLAVTSHEVRTPLNAVLTMAGVLSRELRGPRHRDLARSIETAAGMLLQLLNGILEFTRTESGKATLHPGPVHLPDLIGRVEAVWRARCEDAGLSLRCDVGGPEAALSVLSDSGRLEQTLVNLISNAHKFSPAGSEILVRCRARRARAGSARLRLEVLDRGPGIRPEDQARIFEAFEQTDVGRDKGGAGLGLAICRGNVELMGGRFGRDDRPGGGSVFWLELHAPLADRQTAADREAPAPALAALRILAAEDNPANRQVLKLILEPLGASLDVVANGAEAVTAARAGYDLILMDAKMPVMDGSEATARIRAEEAGAGRRTPIVMVTANVFPDDMARYLADGADAVVAKPIEVSQLFAVIGDLILQPAPQAVPRRRRRRA